MEDAQKFVQTLIKNIEHVIVGKRSTIEFILVAMLCEGHVLLEDVPGSGKTMLARSVATSLGISFKRIQCTPDLLPNDVTGVSILTKRTESLNSSQVRFSSIFCWQMRSIAPHRARNPLYWRQCRSNR